MRGLARIAVSCLVMGALALPSVYGDDEDDLGVLISFHAATDGFNWFNSDGWLSDEVPPCEWYGVECCTGVWCPPGSRIEGLSFPNNNLQRQLPEEIGQLENLLIFNLGGNSLSGPITGEVWSLANLEWLFLEGNDVSGIIPTEIVGLRDIEILTLSDNRFFGTIPAEIGECESLNLLALNSNSFFGQLTRGLLKLRYLSTFLLDHNALHSDDPEILERMSTIHNSDWLASQTLAPDWVALVEVDETTLRLEWSGGGPADLPGHTVVESRLSGGDWEELGQTSSRDVVTFEVDRPSDAQSRHYRLRTVTEPHEHNKNTVHSDPSQTVTFNVAGHSILPAVARLGSHGVRYSSNLDAFNPSGTDLQMELTYTPRSDFGGDSRTATWTLEAGEAESIDDCLEFFFGPFGEEPAVGSLIFNVLEGSPEELLLQSSITALHGDGAEFGQSFPASTFAEGLQSDEVHHLHLATGRMRSNAGFVALEPGTRAHLRLVGPAGRPLNDAVFLFEGDTGNSTQLNDLWSSFWAEPTDDALLEISVQQGSLIAYGSILDGATENPGTSDPTTLRPFAEGREIVTLLEMGTIVGHEEYSGSAVVTNTTDREVIVTAQFHQRGWPGVEAETTFDLGAGESRSFPDIANDLFGIEGVVGTITLENNARGLVASGREYAIHRNDEGEIEGTSGQLIRGLGTDDLLWPGEIYHILGLRQGEDPRGRRVNLAAFNPANAEVRLTLVLIDQASGNSEGSTEITVHGEELIHLNAVINEINPDHDDAPKRISVSVSGPLYVQAFRINATGDPLTLDPLPER